MANSMPPACSILKIVWPGMPPSPRIRPPEKPARRHAPGTRQARGTASPACTCCEGGPAFHRAPGISMVPGGPWRGIGRLRGGASAALRRGLHCAPLQRCQFRRDHQSQTRSSVWPALRHRVFRSAHGQPMVRDASRGAKSGGPRGARLTSRWRRIDVIASAPVPVLTYRTNEHFISLTALPREPRRSQALVIEAVAEVNFVLKAERMG
jgi:hypothetical protein